MDNLAVYVLTCSCLVALAVSEELWAKCVIDSSSGVPGQPIEGTVYLKDPGDGGDVTMWINLSGYDVEDSEHIHGFHVHEYGDLGNQCSNAGSHYNPEGVLHGGPNDDISSRHIGDMGNIGEDEYGRENTVKTDRFIKLSGPYSIVGRSLVVHETIDDHGHGGKVDSNTTGGAGARLACCTIQLIDSANVPELQVAKIAECDIGESTGVTGYEAQPVKGKVVFDQPVGFGNVMIKVDMTGFNPNDGQDMHGFHIHENGELGNECSDAGSHFNPMSVAHGGPNAEIRHIGDLGNVKEVNGEVHTWFTDRMIKLQGKNNIMDKSVVVHYTYDDLGLEGFEDSKTTGHAGARLACCTITEQDDGTGGATLLQASYVVDLMALLLANRP